MGMVCVGQQRAAGPRPAAGVLGLCWAPTCYMGDLTPAPHWYTSPPTNSSVGIANTPQHINPSRSAIQPGSSLPQVCPRWPVAGWPPSGRRSTRHTCRPYAGRPGRTFAGAATTTLPHVCPRCFPPHAGRFAPPTAGRTVTETDRRRSHDRVCNHRVDV